MVKHTRKAKKGGKYIGRGTYGCTFRPALRCSGNNNADKGAITKVMTQENAETEFLHHYILSKIDPHQDFTLYPYRICTPSIRKSNLGYWYYGRCDDILHRPYIGSLLMKDGGDDLSIVLNRLRKGKLNQLHLSIFRALRNLFIGLEHLHAHEFVHCDIKSNNIVCKLTNGVESSYLGFYPGTPTYVMKFIDFGYSDTTDKALDRLQTNADFNYFVFPFDLRLIINSHMEGITSFNVWDLSEYRSEAIRQTRNMGHLPYHVYSSSTPNSVLFYINIQNYITTLTPAGKLEERRTLLKKADVYSLGLVLAEVYLRLTGIKKTAEDSYSKMYSKRLHQTVTLPLYDLVGQMTNPDYRKRITAKDARIIYTQLLLEMEKYIDCKEDTCLPI